MSNLCKPTSKQNQPQLFDLSTEKPTIEENYVSNYIERAALVSKNMKEQKKKNK